MNYPMINLNLDGDGAWRDLLADPKQCSGEPVFKPGVHVLLNKDAVPLQLALLKGGMVGGGYSVSVRLDLPDGQVIVTETSAKLLLSVAKAIEMRIERDKAQD